MPVNFRAKTAKAFAAICSFLILANCNMSTSEIGWRILTNQTLQQLRLPDLRLDNSVDMESRTDWLICRLAVNLNSPSWDKRYPDEITEAERRGYTASKCFDLSGIGRIRQDQ